jgi:NAD(P)-dependent dehydrogenase (short-subunit alcohol dehydrogenase family)
MTARPLESTVALVTGASRGIGRAAAVELARLGAHVVLTARTQGGLEETDDAVRAAGGAATLLPLDLAKEAEQVDALGPSLLERFGRLDALVHCAGALAKLTPAAHIMPKDWADSLAVNASACWRLIRTCDPLLRAAPRGRAVVLTDSVAARPRPYWALYGAAKAAQEHLVRAWALEVAATPLRVALADPGPVATALRRAAYPGEEAASLRPPEDAGRAVAALVAGEPENGALLRV